MQVAYQVIASTLLCPIADRHEGYGWKLSSIIAPDVRFGSLADMCGAKRHVRFTFESRH
jgi:hypothetical protein